MGLAKLKTKITVDEYLESERLSPVKREYVDGEVYAMAGGTDNHNLIAGDLYVLLVNHLRNSICQPFIGDIKVQVARHVYYYPDLLVSCEENPPDPYFRNQPVLIVEVSSPSTERVDRTEKLLYYLQMPSLREYVLIDQHRMNVEIHRREANGGWITYYFNENADNVELTSVDLSIPLVDLYRRASFDKNAGREDE